jgi:hypothetical protein
MLRISLFGPPNRRIQPERYAKLFVHPHNLDIAELFEITQEKTAQIQARRHPCRRFVKYYLLFIHR